MRILLWRSWAPLYEKAAVFSMLKTQAIGGTCSQLLWHARNLVSLGHQVEILGVTLRDTEEEGVLFVGAADRAGQERCVRTGRVSRPDVVFLEGAFAGAPFFRDRFPRVKLVHIGQNIDRQALRSRANPFSLREVIDLYAFVGLGQLADYASRYPALRHKFCYIPNVVPWEWLYSDLRPGPVIEKIVWVGAWAKRGLRQWAVTMEKVLREHPECTWLLCGPSYGLADRSFPRHVLNGLRIPESRIALTSLPMCDLFMALSTARVVLVSLGGESGPISALDAHAAGRPVISGNDMVYKWANWDGTGIRTSSEGERHEALSLLLKDRELGDRLGAAGRKMILREYVEANQRIHLEATLRFAELLDRLGSVGRTRPRHRVLDVLEEWKEKIRRRLA